MGAEESHRASVGDGPALSAGAALILSLGCLHFRGDRLVHSFFFLVRRNLNWISHVIFLPGMLAFAAPPRPGRAPAKAWLHCSDIGLEYGYRSRRQRLPAPALLQGCRKRPP